MSPLDLLTYAIASALLLVIVAAASSVPAWQAARVPAIEACEASEMTQHKRLDVRLA